jgi:C-terminal processing protease CtpA/Prc
LGFWQEFSVAGPDNRVCFSDPLSPCPALSDIAMLFSPSPRRLGAALCALSLCASFAHSASAKENLWLDVARRSITTSELSEHVGLLADDMLVGREAGSRGGHAAAKYIMQRLEAADLKPGGPNGSFTQKFPGNSQNLLAVLEGSDPLLREQYIVVGAHYDHVGYGTRRNSNGPIGFIHNGADDNASGVAALLEVIDALAQSGHRPRRSILFAFWDGEEKGLLGSKYWMRNPTIPVSSIEMAWNIDMVGRLEGGRIEVMGARTAAGLRRQLSTTSLTEGTWVDFTWDYKDNSDHWTFYQAGIPSLCLHTGLHDDYHRPSDDVEKLNIEGIRQVTSYFVEQLCELADVDTLPEFRSQSRFENQHSQRRIQKPLPKLASRLDFSWEYRPGPRPLVYVRRVSRWSQAGEAGLRTGDKIVAVNSLPITNESLLHSLALRGESKLTLLVERNPSEDPVSLDIPLTGEPVRLGLSWRDDSAEPGSVYVTRVVPHSPAAQAGIRLFDRIQALDGEPIAGQADLLAKVRQLLDGDVQKLRLETESRGLAQEKVVSLDLTSPESGDASL